MGHDAIDCRTLIRILDDLVAGTLEPDAARRCERHLASCADCRSFRRDYEATIRLARDAAGAPAADGLDEAMPPGLADAILASRRRGN